MEVYCPLKYLAGYAGLCNPDCALFNASEETCLITLALEHYIGEEEDKVVSEHGEICSWKEAESPLKISENPKVQSVFPHDDWDNPTSGWETWRTTSYNYNDPVLSSLREERKMRKEEGY